MQEEVRLGGLVLVPFGNGKAPRSAYVVGFRESPSIDPSRIRDILGPAQPSGSDREGEFYIRLALWMKDHYGSTLQAALKTVLPARRNARPRLKKQVRLLLGREEALDRLAFYEKKHQTARARLLEGLLEMPVQPWEMVTGKLHVAGQTIRAMERAGILEVSEHTEFRVPTRGIRGETARHPLSPEQETAARTVIGSLKAGGGGVTLLHGITGSGKTEVYLAVIREAVSLGRQAIVLIPEIALTWQTLVRFYRDFGDRVSVINSSMNDSEKMDQWERARRGEIDVIIGPRSALFVPFARTGIIVIDEEHENSYKNESMPRYHARETAIEIASLKGAEVVLGSATPSLDSYTRALQGSYRLFRLTRRLTGGCLPRTRIADMRSELMAGNRSILSRDLKESLDECLASGRQAILFLNRRGYAGCVSCRSCGTALRCPHCDVSLSLHGKDRLVCHYCGYEGRLPARCPSCGSAYLSVLRAGTEQIERSLKKLYPDTGILRMDADTTARKGEYERILTAFGEGKAQILLGTQMIVKGHDFPGVTLVGILMADLSLYAGDYRAAERTFQLLTQAAGRAGRGRDPGQVVIQTYQPDHYALVHAAAQDYEGFYEEEMAYRRLMSYPPASHMLAVQVQSREEDLALRTAGRIRTLLDGAGQKDCQIIGPAAARTARIRDIYRFALYVKSPAYDRLIEYKDRIEALTGPSPSGGAGRDTVLVQFDFDPVNPY